MTDALRWASVRARFDELVELDAAAAQRRLEQLRQSDPGLAAEVAELLAADLAAARDPGVRLVVESRDEADPLLGRRLGNWMIERILGEGGMGRVYLVRRADRAFEKAAALKVLRGGVDSGSFRRRFARERHIVAALEHPGIARVLDGGESAEGLPFLVLEHVEGVDLVTWAVAGHRGSAERVRLFCRVLDAVAYAHRRLVVHRDLKPANVLVTAEGEPKLLDFGIAELLDGGPNLPAATMSAERLLTLEYASPEQIRGEAVTTGSDVYSLGVVLYELLAGRTPFHERTTSPAALVRAIEEEEPERPSSALERALAVAPAFRPQELRGDLDAIVLKALRKEPGARYRSVEELGDDLRRFLEGRPVSARRGTSAYRAAKFARRHRWALAAGGLVLSLFAATSVVYALRLRAGRDVAERRFAETRELARALLFEIHDAIRDVDGATAARRLLLERGLHYLARLRAESGGDPALTREVAEGYLRVGEILSDRRAAAALEMSEQSAPLFETARALIEPQLKASEALEDRRLMVRILGAMARRRFEGELEPESRLSAAKRSVALAEELVRDRPGVPEELRALAGALRDEVDLLGFSGRIAEAAEPARRARAASRRAVELAAGDRTLRLERAESELAYGRVMYRLERGPEALEAFAEALEILEQLAVEEPESVEIRDRLAAVLATSGSHTWQNGLTAEGVALLERAERLYSAIAAADLENHQVRRRLSSTRTELAVAMIADGRLDEAFAQHGEALESLRRATERPGSPAFLIYERAFLQFHLATAARIAAASAADESEREGWLGRARAWYAEALRLHREGERAGIESHLEPETWSLVRRQAAELGVR